MAWELKSTDLKRYPHFDKHLPLQEAQAIVEDFEKVKSNAFFPFIKYEKSYQPFRRRPSSGKMSKPEKKIRIIRYASRRDSYIYSYYRHLISIKYEKELSRLGIQACPIAYRKIGLPGHHKRGKCNIDFAKDAFDFIRSLGVCTAVVVDVSSYFESLDHKRIKEIWCRLFDCDELSADHAAVYKSVTRYAVVDRKKLYERLGYFGEKYRNGMKVKGYLRPANKMPMQLCSLQDFRSKIAGRDKAYETLIEVNKDGYGIPQGAPISDIIANFYLIDFDFLINSYVQERGGFYARYSDDIILILPGGDDEGLRAMDYVRTNIGHFGSKLEIKDRKCSIVAFRSENSKQEFKHVYGKKGKNGLEYLGFRFTGNKVYIKEATLSNLYRKVTNTIKHDVKLRVRRNPAKPVEELARTFDLESIVKKFGRAKDFDTNQEYKNWTFWTYAKRAASNFGLSGDGILRQLKRQRAIIKREVHQAFGKCS